MMIFTDFHHSGLLNSLIMLFEGRLGGWLARPIGEEWHAEGFWHVFDHPATVKQYLGVGAATPDGSANLNDVEVSHRDERGEGLFFCNDISSGKTNKAITLDFFKKRSFDYVIASIPDHILPFRKMIDLYQPKAKLIFQIGNAWDMKDEQIKAVDGIMASAIVNIPLGNPLMVSKPIIEYHQEFNLDIFKYSPPPILKHESGNNNVSISCDTDSCDSACKWFNTNNKLRSIYSGDKRNHLRFRPKIISSLLNVPESFPEWNLFLALENEMTDWEFKAHGGQGRDGVVAGDLGVAEAMRDSMFIWHVKKGGDGYGHILHNTGAVGRPAIVKKSYYAGKLGEALLIDGETCIDIDGLPIVKIIEKIEYYSEPKRYAEMCDRVYNNFKSVVNFDADEHKIREFLAKL